MRSFYNTSSSTEDLINVRAVYRRCAAQDVLGIATTGLILREVLKGGRVDFGEHLPEVTRIATVSWITLGTKWLFGRNVDLFSRVRGLDADEATDLDAEQAPSYAPKERQRTTISQPVRDVDHH